MVAITEGTDFFIVRGQPVGGFKTLVVSTVTTANSADTLDVDIADFGGGSLCGIIGFTHTTVNSIVIQEQPTTTMSGSTVQITIGGASNGQARHFLLFLGPTKNA
jgi:hypothetical protein